LYVDATHGDGNHTDLEAVVVELISHSSADAETL
jgi:hypothetical protein